MTTAKQEAAEAITGAGIRDMPDVMTRPHSEPGPHKYHATAIMQDSNYMASQLKVPHLQQSRMLA